MLGIVLNFAAVLLVALLSAMPAASVEQYTATYDDRPNCEWLLLDCPEPVDSPNTNDVVDFPRNFSRPFPHVIRHKQSGKFYVYLVDRGHLGFIPYGAPRR